MNVLKDWLIYKENVEIWTNDGNEEKFLQLFPVPKKLINELNQKIEKTSMMGTWDDEREKILDYIRQNLGKFAWKRFYPVGHCNSKSKLIKIIIKK